MPNLSIHVLKVSGKLDAVNAKNFKEEAIQYIKKNKTVLILDFSETTFIDSAGLGSLVSILKYVDKNDDKQIALTSLSPQVKQIFEITRLYRLFDIYDSIDEAKESIEKVQIYI